MADLLGATNPVPGYDGASQNRSHSALPQVQDPRVQNVPDLSRVSRADGRTEQQGAGNHLDAGRLRYDSNLQTFLQQLRDAPDLAAVLAKTVVWMRGLVSRGSPRRWHSCWRCCGWIRRDFSAFF